MLKKSLLFFTLLSLVVTTFAQENNARIYVLSHMHYFNILPRDCIVYNQSIKIDLNNKFVKVFTPDEINNSSYKIFYVPPGSYNVLAIIFSNNTLGHDVKEHKLSVTSNEKYYIEINSQLNCYSSSETFKLKKISEINPEIATKKIDKYNAYSLSMYKNCMSPPPWLSESEIKHSRANLQEKQQYQLDLNKAKKRYYKQLANGQLQQKCRNLYLVS